MAGAEPETLTERVKGLALAVGFDLAGVARAEPGPDTEFLREWLSRGYAGEMAWIGRRVEERVDPRRVLDGARSALALGLVYDQGPATSLASGRSGGGPPSLGFASLRAGSAGLLQVARYAGGADYHDVLLDRVRALEAGLPALAGRPVKSRGYVDTGPVLERALAARAGLGWIGKNTCLIHPRLGSHLFLGVVLTDLELEPDAPEPDHCGTCRACLDACPTQAFPEPHVLDATRCISYTTIEARGPIPEALRAAHGSWGFGCDACQDVCPWNTRERRRVPPDAAGLRALLAPRPEWRAPSLAWVLALTEPAWREAVRGTALTRARWRGLLRNALVVAGNSGDRALAPLVRLHAEGPDPLLAEHARWALAALEAGATP